LPLLLLDEQVVVMQVGGGQEARPWRRERRGVAGARGRGDVSGAAWPALVAVAT
jgi:hypothetical protein